MKTLIIIIVILAYIGYKLAAGQWGFCNKHFEDKLKEEEDEENY